MKISRMTLTVTALPSISYLIHIQMVMQPLLNALSLGEVEHNTVVSLR